MKEDKALRQLLRSADAETTPPEGLKEQILTRVFSREIKPAMRLSSVERLLFEKPLWAACAISVPVAGVLWIVSGGDFVGLLSRLIF